MIAIQWNFAMVGRECIEFLMKNPKSLGCLKMMRASFWTQEYDHCCV